MPDPILAVLDWLDRLGDGGPWSFFLTLGLYIGANTCLVPATILTVAAGISRGFVQAAVLAHIGRLVAGIAGFLIGRGLLRARSRRFIATRTRLAALDQAIGEGGLRLVILIRLSPLFPSTVSNYLLGATSLRLRRFIAGTVIGTLPSTIVHALLGSGLKEMHEALEDRPMSWAEKGLFGVGVIATLLALRLVGRLAAAAVDRATPGTSRENPEACATSGSQYTRQDSNLKPPGS